MTSQRDGVMTSSRLGLASARAARRSRQVSARALAALTLAATLSLGAVLPHEAIAQSVPNATAIPAAANSTAVAELDAALMVPLYHALSQTPAPIAIDPTVVQSLSARGDSALRTGPYRLRVSMQVSAGPEGLLLGPELGAPGLQATVDGFIYAVLVVSPMTGLRVPEAVAASLGGTLSAGRTSPADLIVQIDRVETDGDSRRLIHVSLRQAIVLSAIDATALHVIDVSPLVLAVEPAVVAQPPAPSPVPPPAATPAPAPAATSETAAAPSPAPVPVPTPPPPPQTTEAPPTPSAPLPVAPTEPMGPPLIERIDAPMVVIAGGEVRASPQPSGALLFVVSPGASLFVTGRVSVEWVQLRLIDGKLAYLPATAFTAAPVVNPLPATSNLAGAASAAPSGGAVGGQAAAPPVPLAPVPAFPVPAPPIPTPPAAPAATAGQTIVAPAPSPLAAPSLAPATAPAPAPPPAPTPAPEPATANAPPPASPPPASPVPQQEALAEPVFVAERGGVLRNAASARALQVAQVRAGQRFTLLKEQRAADGQVWAEVKPVDGAPGYLLRKDLIAAEEWDAPVSGAVTRVVDAATLVVGTRTIRLGAVEAGPVRFVEIVRPWLTGAASPLTCERRADAAFDCFSADRRDVGETMILNGLARAGVGAPAYYLEAQDKAKQGKKGLWRTAR